MRIMTLNANGIRSAARKGFFDWFLTQHIDVLCIQETRVHAAQLDDPIFWPEGWQAFYVDAEKKGYSGIAIYSRTEPDHLNSHLYHPRCPEFETEARWLEVCYDNLSLVSLYLPSGSSGEKRQTVKFRLMDCLYECLAKFRRNGREYILCGDWNIVHTKADIRNWSANQKRSGCLPEERAWLDHIFRELGYVDAFRQLPQEPEQYTWWSNRGRAWEKNVGWRIDYQVVTPGLAGKVRKTEIYRAQHFSDHAPFTVEYSLELK